MPFLKGITLRTRIFLSMLVLLLLSLIITGAFSVYHFYEENEEYHNERLERKASHLLSAIDYHLKSVDFVDATNLDSVVAPKLEEWSDIHGLDVLFYNMDGELICTSNEYVLRYQSVKEKLNPAFVFKVINQESLITKHWEDSTSVLIAFQFIRDSFNNPLAIVSIPYFENEIIPDQDIDFLEYLITLYIVLFLLAVVIAYFLSNYITHSLSTIGKKLTRTQINRNEPLQWKSNDEIGKLVAAYNRMLSELEENAVKLAKSERESAWKEMAKQVAHEIKNPLTPMRLLVQQLEFTLKTEDKEQLKEFTKAMLDQIDTMVSIADAFSRFAEMPTSKREVFDVKSLLERTVAIFSNLDIEVNAPEEELLVTADKDQLLRVFNNLIKNAWQAVPEEETPKITITLEEVGQYIQIAIKDNGSGIEPEKQERVFEPSFTTKTTGMGLGLAMTKSIIEGLDGKIWLESTPGRGTTFYLNIPKGN
ncbi:MAG: HAMP domain-containing histidine kinase [Schleiferiaceae bacterium]|jgi:signal transduction histidine kinase|nr:HAMP domain-containing histidine kinase [Schleiferiaceae bacterium]